MKKNLAKKITSITVIALVVALVITTVVLALVPKKMNDPIASDYKRVWVYQDNVSAAFSYVANPTTDEQRAHNEIIETIKELHEESLKDSVLSAIFQGTGSFKSEVTKTKKNNALTSVAEQTGNAIVFEYFEDQELKVNGETYKDEGTLSASPVTFGKIIMTLGTSENFEQCTIYLVDSSDGHSYYQVTFLAAQAELNDYVSSIDFGLAN